MPLPHPQDIANGYADEPDEDDFRAEIERLEAGLRAVLAYHQVTHCHAAARAPRWQVSGCPN